MRMQALDIISDICVFMVNRYHDEKAWTVMDVEAEGRES